MSVTLTISQKEMNAFKKNLKKFKTKNTTLIRSRMAIAGKEMESVAKLTVTNAGLVDTGRLRSSLVAHSIDNGYGQELITGANKDDLDKSDPDTKPIVLVAYYAKYHEPKYRFMKKGQKAGYDKFIKLMSR